jgi:nitrogen regulatory protein PII
MKEIKAYVRAERISHVIRELKYAGIHEMNIINVMALTEQIRPEDLELSIELTSTYAKMVKIEIVAPAVRAVKITETIREAAHTGKPGDGIIYISTVGDAVKVRTGETGPEALE